MTTKDTYYLAINVAGVAAVVGTRIYPDVLPEKCVYPAIVYSFKVSPIMGISGNKLGEDLEFPTSCWAETRAAADAAADAVEAALSGTVFYVASREDAYDPETGLFATVLAVAA